MTGRIWSTLAAVLILGTPASARTWKMATGPTDGTYHIIGSAIQKAVSASKPDLKFDFVTTSGAVSNVELIRQGKVDFAIAQNDVIGEAVAGWRRNPKGRMPWRTVLVLLQEPVQIVVGASVKEDRIDALSNRPVALGTVGSGSSFTATEILKMLNIVPVPVPSRSADERAKLLSNPKIAQAAFFIANSPTPQIASLLCDPKFRLLPFATAEIAALHDSSPFYVSSVIPEHTYPGQNHDIPTIAVLNLLLCRADLPVNVVRDVAAAVLSDAASPDSALREAHPGTDLAQMVLRSPQAAAPLHDGAQQALNTVPLAFRIKARMQWIVWVLATFMIALVIFVAVRRDFRLRLMNRITGRTPGRLGAVARYLLLTPFLWYVITALSILAIVCSIGTLLMYSLESDINVSFSTLGVSATSILLFLISDLGDRAPVTNAGWAVTLAMLLAGLFVVAFVTGKFASELIQRASGVLHMHKNTARDSTLIVGWNSRAEKVVRELLVAQEHGLLGHGIAVLTEQPVDVKQCPAEFQRHCVTFVVGDAFDHRRLKEIGAHEARCVIVMADDSAEDPDGKTALTVLAMHTLYKEVGLKDEDPHPRICVEVKNHRKQDIIRDAGADEIVCHEDYGLGVLAQCAISIKMSEVYQDLLSYGDDGNEFYVLISPHGKHTGDEPEIPEDIWDGLFNGKTFAQAADVFTHRRSASHSVILVGIRGEDEHIHLNPEKHFALKPGDDLIVMARQRPSLDFLRSAMRERESLDGTLLTGEPAAGTRSSIR